MAQITLSLAGSSSTPATLLEHDLYFHSLKEIEKFLYIRDVDKLCVPIQYIESKRINSKDNLIVINKSFSVKDNVVTQGKEFNFVNSATFFSPYKDILATNKSVISSNGKTVPLFYKMRLSTGTTSVLFHKVTSGNLPKLEEEFIVEDDMLYTNFSNYYNELTGAYCIYFVSYSGESNYNDLLDVEAVATEADWYDLDDEGELLDYPLYIKEEGDGGWTFTFNSVGPWYIKALAKNSIQPKIALRESNQIWNLQVTVGDFFSMVNGSMKRFRLPEFDLLPFNPYAPYLYDSNDPCIKINRNILLTARKSLLIDPVSGIHLDLYIKDADGNIVRALTTDTGRTGYVLNTSVLWESDKIISWNSQGFISLGCELHVSQRAEASYYYSSQLYEDKRVNLNPLMNRRMKKYTYVYYLIPNVGDLENALHYLVVDESGYIVDVSQGESESYLNLKLRNEDTSYNSDTVVGLLYVSDTEPDTFSSRYVTGYENDFGYMILAEISLRDTAFIADVFGFPVSRSTPFPNNEEAKTALLKNPKLLYSQYFLSGKVPQSNVMITEVPIEVLITYGGELTEEQVTIYLNQNAPANLIQVIKYIYPRSELEVTSTVSGEVEIEISWEGPDLTYSLYKRENTSLEGELVDEFVDPVEGTILYTDTVDPGLVLFYYVVISRGDIVYPPSQEIGVKVYE